MQDNETFVGILLIMLVVVAPAVLVLGPIVLEESGKLFCKMTGRKPIK